MIWLHSVRWRGAHGKNFKNLITVYNFNAHQAKVSGVFFYYFDKVILRRVFFFFFFLFSQTTREHMNDSWWDVLVSKV